MGDATIQLYSPHGVWRAVYARRLALHRAADDTVLAAWHLDTEAFTLDRSEPWASEAATRDEREAAGAVALAALAAWPFIRTRAAIRTAAVHAHRAGFAAGLHVAAEPGDDGDYPDDDTAVAGADLTDSQADHTAAVTLTTVITATARRAGRTLADTDDPDAATRTVRDGHDLQLAVDVAVSAAYGLGMLSAYYATGCRSVDWMTAGDGRVCTACSDAEAGSPYPLLAAPRLPQHPNCRCCLAPA
ncbi:hypothetical protein [Kitasatospora sp. NPDC056731]|uniref:hypothetical protein n=1 Tax=Kitasatospora sp. NPDC056731 TaxID=3155422 RepID=UPI00341B05D7